MQRSIYLVVFLSSALILSCALGDGRGFATVDGSLSITMDNGEAPALEIFEVTVGALQLDGVTVTEGYGTEAVSSALPVGLTFAPLDGAAPASFGPVEVDRGPYSTISVIISKVSVKSELGGTPFDLVLAPVGGIVVSAQADLPINRDELPRISISGVITLSNNVLGGVDLSKGIDAVADKIAQNIEAGASLNATWIRRGD